MNFKHSGSVGDVIYALCAVREFTEQANIYLQCNVPGNYSRRFPWHPSGDLRLSARMAQNLLPLIRAQPYVKSANLWQGSEPIDVDLDQFRETHVPLNSGNIARYFGHMFPVNPQPWHAWLTVKPDLDYTDAVVVNRTHRYRNENIDWNILQKIKRPIYFVGCPEETPEWRHLAEFVHTPDLLRAAEIIAACHLFIGNQSACWSIAEGLKVKRILEICPYCPNALPMGPNGWECDRQEGWERTILELAK